MVASGLSCRVRRGVISWTHLFYPGLRERALRVSSAGALCMFSAQRRAYSIPAQQKWLEVRSELRLLRWCVHTCDEHRSRAFSHVSLLMDSGIDLAHLRYTFQCTCMACRGAKSERAVPLVDTKRNLFDTYSTIFTHCIDSQGPICGSGYGWSDLRLVKNYAFLRMFTEFWRGESQSAKELENRFQVGLVSTARVFRDPN